MSVSSFFLDRLFLFLLFSVNIFHSKFIDMGYTDMAIELYLPREAE